MTALRHLNLTAAEVRAALAGEPVIKERKVTPQPGPGYKYQGPLINGNPTTPMHEWWSYDSGLTIRSPWGSPGQRFYVRERWILNMEQEPVYFASDDIILYPGGDKWHAARTMPREYSRLDLGLLAVSVYQDAGVWRWRGEFGRVTA